MKEPNRRYTRDFLGMLGADFRQTREEYTGLVGAIDRLRGQIAALRAVLKTSQRTTHRSAGRDSARG